MNICSNRQWWRGAIIYQIYPRSFCDSTGNGIGDLQGIISKIPYIASLGVDAIWISPFFTSPMKDFGYDVSDYTDVDPIFGVIEDFKQLIESAHQAGVKVIIDQVLSHTSDQHQWFIDSKSLQNDLKTDWYVWADPKPDGTAPNNWLSFFGGSAWTFDSNRQQYYLHNFLSSQPDLNYHNPQVQDAVLEVLKFWLELGVDGFRLDTVNMYFCDALLRDNPPRDPSQPIQGMNSTNPRSYQAQIYNVNRPENTLFLERIRSLLEQYDDRTTLGEIGSVEDTIGMMAEYTGGDNRLHMCYTADLLGENKSAQFIKDVVEKTDAKLGDGWPCWSLGNHDAIRFVTRWGREVQDKQAFAKAMLALVVTLRGSICIYQGEELGLAEAEVAFEDLVDPFGIAFWPDYKGRDGCRTPMVWQSEGNGGFSSGNAPWLPIAKEHLAFAPDSQEKDNQSPLNCFRQLMRLRKDYPALIEGNIDVISAQDDVLIFVRKTMNQQCFVAVNMSEAVKNVPCDNSWQAIEVTSLVTQRSGDNLVLAPWQVFFASK